MNPDFRDLLAAFNARGVEFLVVGAHALAAHGLVRATKDLDLWVRPDPDNARRVLAALADFGAPLHDLTVEDLSRPGLIFQIGVEPIRIGVITVIDGVRFDEAWIQRITATFADQHVSVSRTPAREQARRREGTGSARREVARETPSEDALARARELIIASAPPPNNASQLTSSSLASLPLAHAAERRYIGRADALSEMRSGIGRRSTRMAALLERRARVFRVSQSPTSGTLSQRGGASPSARFLGPLVVLSRLLPLLYPLRQNLVPTAESLFARFFFSSSSTIPTVMVPGSTSESR